MTNDGDALDVVTVKASGAGGVTVSLLGLFAVPKGNTFGLGLHQPSVSSGTSRIGPNLTYYLLHPGARMIYGSFGTEALSFIILRAVAVSLVYIAVFLLRYIIRSSALRSNEGSLYPPRSTIGERTWDGVEGVRRMSPKKLDLVIAIAIAASAGHELHHLVIGDAVGSGVKSYAGWALYVPAVVLMLYVPLWASRRLDGNSRKISLAAFGLLGAFWSLSWTSIGLYALYELVSWLAGNAPTGSVAVSPWLGLSTILQFFTGLPLLILGTNEVRVKWKPPLM